MNRSTHLPSCACRICRGTTQPLPVFRSLYAEPSSDLPPPHGIHTLTSRAVTRRMERES